jgi:hypothetical protein
LALHLASGTQRTLEMRTEVTCGLAALLVPVPGDAFVGLAPRAGAAPPVPAAAAAAGPPPSTARAHASAAARVAASTVQ